MRFVLTKTYLKALKRMGVSAPEGQAILAAIAASPEAGDVIRGTGGLRKIRFGFGGRGKRGGGRAVYYVIVGDDTTAMIFAYAKNEQSDLSPAQRKLLADMVKEITDG